MRVSRQGNRFRNHCPCDARYPCSTLCPFAPSRLGVWQWYTTRGNWTRLHWHRSATHYTWEGYTGKDCTDHRWLISCIKISLYPSPGFKPLSEECTFIILVAYSLKTINVIITFVVMYLVSVNLVGYETKVSPKVTSTKNKLAESTLHRKDNEEMIRYKTMGG